MLLDLLDFVDDCWYFLDFFFLFCFKWDIVRVGFIVFIIVFFIYLKFGRCFFLLGLLVVEFDVLFGECDSCLLGVVKFFEERFFLEFKGDFLFFFFSLYWDLDFLDVIGFFLLLLILLVMFFLVLSCLFDWLFLVDFLWVVLWI